MSFSEAADDAEIGGIALMNRILEGETILVAGAGGIGVDGGTTMRP